MQFENTQLGLDWTELTAEHDVEFQRLRFLIRIPAWVDSKPNHENHLKLSVLIEKSESKQRWSGLKVFPRPSTTVLLCHPRSGELKFLINYQLCLPSEDCWNVPLWLHCVARLFFTQLIIRYLSILSQYNKSCSSTTLIIIHRFVSVNFVCCRSTPWCDWATNLKFRHSHKIKWSPLCIGCLFMLIRILPVYQIFERENLNVQNRDLLLILHPFNLR